MQHAYRFVCANGNEYTSNGESPVQAWALIKKDQFMLGVVEVVDLDWKIKTQKETIERLTKQLDKVQPPS